MVDDDTGAAQPGVTRAPRPPQRYGDVRPPWHRGAARALAGVAVVAGLAWVVWAGLHQAQRDVSWEDVGFSITGDSQVVVTFDVVKDPQATATCRLEALNVMHAVVGVAQVEIGPTDQKASRHREPVTTQERPVTGIVDHCEVVKGVP
ncbi:MAG: DUF4307 domain-containing protein [Actinomycetes bacterium]